MTTGKTKSVIKLLFGFVKHPLARECFAYLDNKPVGTKRRNQQQKNGKNQTDY